MKIMLTPVQNTTFGGIQGFTRKPATPWYDDDGEFAGIVHQERNWTYVLVKDAGHLVPYNKPARVRPLLLLSGIHVHALMVHGIRRATCFFGNSFLGTTRPG